MAACCHLHEIVFSRALADETVVHELCMVILNWCRVPALSERISAVIDARLALEAAEVRFFALGDIAQSCSSSLKHCAVLNGPQWIDPSGFVACDAGIAEQQHPCSDSVTQS